MHRSRTFASLFSGIGGLDYGLHARMTCTLMCEVAEHPRAILRRRFPDTPIKEDVRDVTGTDLAGADVLAAGFPCTDTSLSAPNRKGLHGDRSGLFFEIPRLIDEAGPEWVVIENPEGVFTSNDGRDWLTVTRALGNRGYGWAYRVVDGNHLGTPQRRRRILLVAHRGGDPAVPWSVLDDPGPSVEVPAAPLLGDEQGEGGPGLGRARGADGRELTVWRKGARAQKKIELGGWESWLRDDKGNTLTCFDVGEGFGRQTHIIADDGRLRVPTITEWERLSGFPDGWTDVPGVPISARQKALGNCVHAGTGEWLARRLVAKMDAMDAEGRVAVPA